MKVQPLDLENRDSMAQEKQKHESMELITTFLPPALHDTTILVRLLREMQKHHKWGSLILHYSSHSPRFIRVLSFSAGIISMLFMQAVLYTTTTQPDDGTCKELMTPAACLEAKSDFNSAYTKCYWDQNSGSCLFRQPPRSMQGLLLITIFATLVGSPMDILSDYLINLLYQISQHDKHHREINMALAASIARRGRRRVQIENRVEHVQAQRQHQPAMHSERTTALSALAEWAQFKNRVRNCREHIRDSSQRRAFDGKSICN